MKCAALDDVAEIATQLGLAGEAAKSGRRVIAERYQVDTLVETRGVTRIFTGYDAVADLPVEIYQVRDLSHDPARLWYENFERIARAWASANSPFLLDFRDTHFDHADAFYLITERFPGRDLQLRLKAGTTLHPFSAALIGGQVALGVHELHRAGLIHGGLSARCARLHEIRVHVKLVDFEFAVPAGELARSGGEFRGYPLVMPPERTCWKPALDSGDVFQLGNLIVWLATGSPVSSRLWLQQLGLTSALYADDRELQARLGELLCASATNRPEQIDPWLDRHLSSWSSPAVSEGTRCCIACAMPLA